MYLTESQILLDLLRAFGLGMFVMAGLFCTLGKR